MSSEVAAAPVQVEVLTDEKLMDVAEEQNEPEVQTGPMVGGNDICHVEKKSEETTEDVKSDEIDAPIPAELQAPEAPPIDNIEEEEEQSNADELDETLASEPLSDEVASDVSSFISEDDPLGSLRRLLNQVLIHFTEDYGSRPTSAGTSGGLGLGSPSGDASVGKGGSLSRHSSGIIDLCMRSVASNTLAASMQRRLAMKSNNQRRRRSINDDIKDSALSDKLERFGSEDGGSPLNALAQSLVNFLLTTPETQNNHHSAFPSNADAISQVSPLVINCISSLILAAVHFANAQSAINAVTSSSSSSSSSAAINTSGVVVGGRGGLRSSSITVDSGSAAYPIISVPRMCAYMLDRVELTLRSLFNFKHYFALHLMTDAKRCRLFALQCALYRRFPLLTTEGCTSLARPPVFYGTKQCSLFASGTTASNERKRVAWELLQTDACFKTIPSRTTRSGDSRAAGSTSDSVKDSADGSATDASKSSSSAMSGLIECMDLRSLEQSIERDQSRGKLPCVVVASLTDDLYKMRQICNRQGLWLHVEADSNPLTRQALLLAASSSLPKSTQILMQCADSISTHPAQWFADSKSDECVSDGEIGADVTLVFIREDMRDTPPPLIGFTALDFGLLFPLWFQLCLNSGPSFDSPSEIGSGSTPAAVAAGASAGRSSVSPPPTVSHASLVKARVDHSLALVAHLKSLVSSDKARSLLGDRSRGAVGVGGGSSSLELKNLSPDSVFSGVSFGPESCAPHVLLFEILPLQSSVGFDLDLICTDAWRLDEYLLSNVLTYFNNNSSLFKGGDALSKAIGLCGQQRGGSATAHSYTSRNGGGFEFTPLSLNTNDCLRIKNNDLNIMVDLICDSINHIRQCVMLRGYLQSLLIRAEAKGELLWIDSSEIICTDFDGASEMFDMSDMLSSFNHPSSPVSDTSAVSSSFINEESFASLVTLGGFRYVPAYYSQFPKSPSVNLLNIALYKQLISQNDGKNEEIFQLALLSDGGGFVIVINPSLLSGDHKDLKVMCDELFNDQIVKALNNLIYPKVIMDEMSAALREAMSTAEKQLMDEVSQEYSADNMIRSIPLFGSMYGWLIPDDSSSSTAPSAASSAGAGSASGGAGATSVAGSSHISPMSSVDDQVMGKVRGRSFDMISRRLVATSAPRAALNTNIADDSSGNNDYNSSGLVAEERPVGLTGALSGNHISEYESTPAQPL